MYDYEYEEDVLISLQMLKYLHDNSPERFQQTLDMFSEFDVDAFYMAADYAFWDIFPDGMAGQDEDSDFTVLYLYHPELDRCYDIGKQWCNLHCRGYIAWQKRIRDTVIRISPHLKDKEPAYYYSDILVPNGKTLQDFISRR